MKIALINTIKPEAGSGDGITDYTYQIYNRLKIKNKVDLVYGLEKSKRNDVMGNIIVHSVFKSKIRKLAKSDYDIIHITHQELGFAAKILKKAHCKAKILTSVHDLMRLTEQEKKGFHSGIMQSTFNRLVSSSIHDAIKYSDMIIFSGSTVQNDSVNRFKHLGKWETTPLAPREQFRSTKLAQKSKGKQFNVGYVGALAFRKNPKFILQTALLMKKDPKYKFTIWGSGAEKPNLIEMKEKHKLDNVTFMGFAPEKELMKIYDSFDLFFYPSLEEGSSLPILDAQARGLPIIVYKDNHMDVEITRFCFTAKNPKNAQSIIRKLGTKGYDKRSKERSTAYARGFSWGRVASETFEAYKSLLAKN